MTMELEAGQRAREYFHGLTVLPGAWTVIRVDGRSFSRLTEQHFDKPFDDRVADLMTVTAQALLTELGARYAYTQSDEISVLLAPGHDLFGRGVEKLVSVSAGLASATFTHAAGVPAHFDSRLWLGTAPGDVADYFAWRQADAMRNALSAWCYWTLRKAGRSARAASQALAGTSTADRNQLLFEHGININDTPAWQRRGAGLWWETYPRTGFDPVRGTEATATRRRITVERELPLHDDYRALVHRLAAPDAS
jgi:tRNA(His) 5'-end guanylyltransferase